MGKERKTITVDINVYHKYVEFTSIARLVNKKHQVKDDLIYLFELGIGLYQTRVDEEQGEIEKPSNEAKILEFCNLLRYELSLDEIDVHSFKVPLSWFKDKIMLFFNIKDKDAVNARKTRILKILNLKQVREGNGYYIAHKSYGIRG